MNQRRVLAALAVIAISGTFVGCSKATYSPPPTGGNEDVATSDIGDIPEFEGAWSDLFSSVYSSPTTTDAQRQILSDAVISDAEYVQLRDEFKNCLEDLGLDVELYADGGFSVDESSTLNESQISGSAVPECEAKSVGSVGLLYEQIRRNPQQQDEATIMVECLKNSGVVGEAYTPAEYRRDLDAYSGLDWDSTDVHRCTQDPLGLLEGTSSSSKR